MQPVHAIQKSGFTLKIFQDEDAQSPDEWGDDGLFLVAKHRDFFVPPSKNERNFDVQTTIDDHKKTHWVFLLEAYIHSGVSLALAGEGNYPDRRWDVSTLGAVFASKKEWRLRDKARKAALSYIGEWNKYLSGDVWGYEVQLEGEDLDSCWGFYGFEYAKEQAIEALESCVKRAAQLIPQPGEH